MTTENPMLIDSQPIPDGKPEFLPSADLLLDPDNPRLSAGARTVDQLELARHLWVEMSVDEIVYSIAYNSFYRTEPLLVIPNKDGIAGPDTQKMIVIEGNRRLVAVKILLNDDLRSTLKATDVPAITEEAKKRLEKIPVIVYQSKQEIWTYIGFRHINGTKVWDSFSKAQHIATVHDLYKQSLDAIARQIGDRHSTVIRLYRGYRVLKQAQEEIGFKIEDRYRSRFAFSHLYTALDQPDFLKFLGVNVESDPDSQRVPKEKLPHLQELMLWLYGRKSEGKAPLVRSQNPDLKKLRESIANAQSLTALRAGVSLDQAHEMSIPDHRRFRTAMTFAKGSLQEARGTVVPGYEGEDDLFQIAADIKRLADTTWDDMEKIRSSQAKV